FLTRPIYDLLLTLVGVCDVQLLVLQCPSNYPDDFRLIVKHKSVSIQLANRQIKYLPSGRFSNPCPYLQNEYMPVIRGKVRGNGKVKVKKKKKSSYPIAQSSYSHFY